MWDTTKYPTTYQIPNSFILILIVLWWRRRVKRFSTHYKKVFNYPRFFNNINTLKTVENYNKTWIYLTLQILSNLYNWKCGIEVKNHVY